MYLCELEKILLHRIVQEMYLRYEQIARITKNPLEYNTQRELHGIRVSRHIDPADFGIVFSSSG